MAAPGREVVDWTRRRPPGNSPPRSSTTSVRKTRIHGPSIRWCKAHCSRSWRPCVRRSRRPDRRPVHTDGVQPDAFKNCGGISSCAGADFVREHVRQHGEPGDQFRRRAAPQQAARGGRVAGAEGPKVRGRGGQRLGPVPGVQVGEPERPCRGSVERAPRTPAGVAASRSGCKAGFSGHTTACVWSAGAIP